MPGDEEVSPTWDNFITSTYFTHETKTRIAREVLEIKQHWGLDWQHELSTGGIHIQNQPSFHLANTLAQLAGFEPDLTRVLASLPDFRAFQAAQAPIAGKRVDPRTPSLFGTVEQRVEHTSYRFLEAWLEFLKPPVLPPSVNTGRAKRAAARAATKRSAPSSASSSRRRRTRDSALPIEVGRAQDTVSPAAGDTTISAVEPADESIYLISELENTGVQLTFDDEELRIPPSPARDQRTHTPHNMSSGVASMLQDPLLRQVAKLLSETKHQETALRRKAREAEVALDKARDEVDTVRQNIEDQPVIEVKATVCLIEKAVEELETDRTAEQKLYAFMSAHQDEYRRLASASASAAANADALDPTDTEDAIAEMTAKINAYEDAKNKLQDAETAVDDAENAYAESKEALITFETRLGEVQDITRDWDNEFRFRTLDDELAKVKDS